ncbi:MAG: protein phosphatase 2C domain-containing protein [Hydrogenophaga sp.]|uniref:PP2C family protein-serine/threonine phosphatase n=1 Tax=Hydrogenophaga sp. TaxID=1904254 RepID=UPI0027279E5B|nr:protein phosphatase 2C domain-containing protein [Hydrogenophaga sp.]MDO9147172.1 protein phosphatase 2C domain-containing protein [Hydrogenophaga sp.]MDO9604046.1 protein phosphatase 2C domain-containing protein [Hydrogenophaga sp.]
MKFSVYQISRQGGRERNEDRMGYAYTRESGLFVLADGMGGHPEGAMAAQLALQTFSAYFQKAANPAVREVPEFLNSALMAAHHQIIRYAAEKGMLDTPRTTLVAAVMERNQMHWVHCGDSRLYIVRDGELLARTRDHSYMEQEAHLGRATDHINRNILFTCLGSPAKPVLDLSGPMQLLQGDRVLMCSDGLWGTVTDSEIVSELARRPLEQAVPELVAMALKRGGPRCDNVTVLAMEWETAEEFQTTCVSTEDIDDGVFASTIQSGVPDPTIEDMDDKAIERSIAEINEAIRRTAERNS